MKSQKLRQKKILKLTLDYSQLSKRNIARKKSLHLVVEVFKISTAEQNKYFKEKVRDYIPWIESYLMEEFA